MDRAYKEQPSDFWDRVLNAQVPPHSVSKAELMKRLAATKDIIPSHDNRSTSHDVPTFHDYISEHKWYAQHYIYK